MNEQAISTSFVRTLQVEGAALLARHGEDIATSTRGGEEFAFHVLDRIGGSAMYFKKGASETTHQKHAAICENHKATAESIEELALKYDMSNRQIYNVIRATSDLTTSKRPASNLGIQCIAIEAARMLLKAGISPNDAACAARGLTGIIVAKFGGKTFYVPKAIALKTAQKHAEIWRQYQLGATYKDLAIRFELSERQIMSIVSSYAHKERKGGGISLTTLSLLKRRILDVALNNKGVNPDIDSLLAAAADNVGQAQIIVGSSQEHLKERSEEYVIHG